jgi:predicted transcriptional regulator
MERKFLLLSRRLDILQTLKSLERFLMVEKAILSFLNLQRRQYNEDGNCAFEKGSAID